MKFSVLILPEASRLGDVIDVFKQEIGYEIDILLHKYHDLTALYFTSNSLNA